MKARSWVITERLTGAVIVETFDEKKVAALNTAKYKATPILEHLQALNDSIKQGAQNADALVAIVKSKRGLQ